MAEVERPEIKDKCERGCRDRVLTSGLGQRLVKLCLRRNAPMNLKNEEGNTAAHLAFLFNYKEVAEYLVSKGAKTNIPNNQGQTCEQMLETDVPELERS